MHRKTLMEIRRKWKISLRRFALCDFACSTFIPMNIEFLEQTCTSFPGVTTDVKWGNDLVFSVAEKMFCVCSMDPPFKTSFKVPDAEFEELSVRDGFEPAPYMARAKWVLVTNPSKLNRKEWEEYLMQSYELVKSKLSKKLQENLRKEQGTRHKAQESNGKASLSTIGKSKPKVKSTRVKSKKAK